jgi:hypothetical protein
MDGDGFQDVVASTTEGISVLTGNGDGTFAPPLARDIGETAPVGLALGTLNDDPKTDVVFGTGPAANYVGVLLGTGDGQFSTYSQFPAGTLPENVAIDEFDGDQDLDIVAANARSNTLSVLPGRGDGTFESFRTLYLKPARSSAGEVAIRDFNRDGRSDLAVLVLGNNGYDPSVPVRDRLNLLIGNGRGGFSTPAVYEIGKTPLGLDTGVLNEGPDPDLVTANSDSNDVSVLLNAGPSARILALGFKAAQRRFVGSIRSSDPTCISGQRIRILKRRAGPDRRVGSVVTGEAGSFRLGYGRKPGTYYARVRPWSACRAESSKVVRIRR